MTNTRKIIFYISLILISLIVVATFLTATNYIQLAIAVLLYPPLAFTIFKYSTNGNLNKLSSKKALHSPSKKSPLKEEQAELTEEKESPQSTIGIADIDKRAFLKLIGATSLSFFLFSIFGRKTENLIFGQSPPGATSLEDATGNKVNPAQKLPTDGYQVTEIEEDSDTFVGFTNKNGQWFIMKEDSQAGSFRYTKGDSNFPKHWSNRENLKYDYFYNVFSS